MSVSLILNMEYAVLREDLVSSRPDIDISAVDKAYEFARKAHEGQLRYSGEPYIIHPVAAAGILLRIQPDLPSIQACLMHDVTEDTERTLEDIEAEFDEEVANLVKGCEDLAIVKAKGRGLQSNKWKKMFLAMASDVRIVFIKLADRLHNMQTLQHVPEHKRERIARETLDVHAGVASRLGIYKLKGDLEDLCFKYLYPAEYKRLSDKLDEHRARSKECMLFATSQVEQLLAREHVKMLKVRGRMKHLWSIWQKMQRYDTDELGDVYDIFAVRVILPDESDLYSTLGVLHREYIPLQDRFKDYVAAPKPNGYRSLHTTLVGIGGVLYDEPTEVQIRTEQMHKEAEIGVASHWSYKLGRQRHFAVHGALMRVQAVAGEDPSVAGLIQDWVEKYQYLRPDDRGKVEQLLKERGVTEKDLADIRKGRSRENFKFRPNVDEQLAWLRGLAEVDVPMRSAELDLYPDRIFVLTPQSKVVELPRGSTPVDFAYSIHTEVGHKMTHTKVNGRVVPLDYELRNGEVVEIVTRNNSRPSRYWLSFAVTPSARAKIKNWFNKQAREENIAAGRDMVNRQLEGIGKSLLDDKLSLLKEYGGKKRTLQEREQLLEGLGLGVMTAGQFVRNLFPGEEVQRRSEKAERAASTEEAVGFAKKYSDKVLVTGESDLPVILSACCKAKPGDPIIGYVTRGNNIRIHKQSCRELSGLEGERFVSAHWKEDEL
jgi:GTP diphosphokinase / guanosine-3',5'-bis(diphosphate) 3'-diphosphatase